MVEQPAAARPNPSTSARPAERAKGSVMGEKSPEKSAGAILCDRHAPCGPPLRAPICKIDPSAQERAAQHRGAKCPSCRVFSARSGIAIAFARSRSEEQQSELQ